MLENCPASIKTQKTAKFFALVVEGFGVVHVGFSDEVVECHVTFQSSDMVPQVGVQLIKGSR
jgi:hypothetical protein